MDVLSSVCVRLNALLEVHLTAHAHPYISAHGSLRSIEHNCPPRTALALNHRTCEEDEGCLQKCMCVRRAGRDGNLKEFRDCGSDYFSLIMEPLNNSNQNHNDAINTFEEGTCVYSFCSMLPNVTCTIFQFFFL